MNINMQAAMLDFEGAYEGDPVEAAADAELILRDPATNRARVAFLRAIRRVGGAAVAPGGEPGRGEASEDAPAGFAAEIEVLARVGVLEALLNEEIDHDRLARLLESPEGLLAANRRLAPDEDSRPAVAAVTIEDFVAREVGRLLNQFPNPSALLGREDLRRLRDGVVGAARGVGVLADTDGDRWLHEAMARKLREVRRENAGVTVRSGLVPSAVRAAERLLILLEAQDRLLAELGQDEEFAHVATWYQLAEDAALSDEEIAALWDEDPSVVRDALAQERAMLEVDPGDLPHE
jgi:hypothetical protein